VEKNLKVLAQFVLSLLRREREFMRLVQLKIEYSLYLGGSKNLLDRA